MPLPFSKETKEIVVAKLKELLEQPTNSELFIIYSETRKQKVSGICAIIQYTLCYDYGTISSRKEEPAVWYFMAQSLRLAKIKNIVPNCSYPTYVDETKKMTTARKDFIRYLLAHIEELER